MSNPKVSIITVSYNSEKTIERTIKSIIGQDYENLEYIIIDGGSTDRTLEIIKKYETHITYWKSEPDNGISDAFNKGIKVATGEIIGIINSDDGLCENALKTLSSAYEQSIGVYRGNVVLWNEKTGFKCIEKPSMKFSKVPITVKVSHQSTFVRKDIYEKYGNYDTKCKFVMDYDLLTRLFNAGVIFKHVDSPLAFYTLGGVTFSKYTRERLQESKYVFKKNGANNFDIAIYIVVKRIKVFLNKIIKKDILLKIRN